ncbi:hypothetical protein EON64_19670 [archaeon]|nr:MAG: hypothetical protein EON64_19670 [archaeon]
MPVGFVGGKHHVGATDLVSLYATEVAQVQGAGAAQRPPRHLRPRNHCVAVGVTAQCGGEEKGEEGLWSGKGLEEGDLLYALFGTDSS